MMIDSVYEASPVKRHRATKAEMEARRESLLRIVAVMKPMTVRQVFYQATVRGIVEKTEAGYGQVQRELAKLRRDGRLAVTEAQIEAWDLPTRPTKKTDTRAKQFGKLSCELDAIDPHRLRGLVREAIERHLPPEQFRILKVAEESERELIHQWASIVCGQA